MRLTAGDINIYHARLIADQQISYVLEFAEPLDVRRLDSAGVDMLLRCMSEAMKHDGDVKLAAPSPEALVVLELTRTGRLFEIYENATDAARSYSSFLPNVLRQFAAADHSTIVFPSQAPKPTVAKEGKDAA